VTGWRLQNLFRQKSEIIHILFWYAIQQERCGDTGLFDAILHLKKREFDRWRPHELLWHSDASEIFTYASPRAIILVTPYLDWGREPLSGSQDLISKWMATISLVPYTEEVAEGVVDMLLQIAPNPHLRSFIPADLWLRLNERRSLPPVCKGRRLGDNRDTVRTVREFNDIGILTSYLIMIWSEWKPLDGDGFAEMRTSVREDFDGVSSNGHHRAELIQRLDYILGELDRRSGGPDANLGDDKLWRNEIERHSPVMKDQYGELKRILQEVDQAATETPNCMSPSFIFLSLLTLVDLQNSTPPSCVPCLSGVYNLAFGTISVIWDEPLCLFPSHIIVFLCSPRRLGTVVTLPRHIPLRFL